MRMAEDLKEPRKEPRVARGVKGLLAEFQQFALKGNVIDLAVAVVVGTAFTRIINSLVSDIITPVTQLLGNPNTFQSFSITLRAAGLSQNGSTTPPVVLSYGDFLQGVISFIISVGIIFIIIKIFSTARDRLFRREASGEAPPAPPPTPEVAVLQEIRDTLKEMRGVNKEHP